MHNYTKKWVNLDNSIIRNVGCDPFEDFID